MEEKKYLTELNPEQRKAVLQTEGPLLVLAGAGAGKTKTVAHRILHLVKNGVTPSEILAITFTNKAAKEMRARVEKLLDNDEDVNRPVSSFERPFIATFHALGVHIIRENSSLLGIPRQFTIYDRSDSLSAVRDALKESGYDPKQYEPSKILGLISRHKGNGTTFSSFTPEDAGNFRDTLLMSVWRKYEEQLTHDKALDFDDLLLRTFVLLKTNPEILTRYQKQWRYIHIDEYQDTNKIQYDLSKLLAGDTHNICVVGDIDQSIYSWRGADFKNIMRFEKDYPETVMCVLEENYRSTETILKAANAVIAKNTMRKEKNLFTRQGMGEKISMHVAYDERDEARVIAEKADSLVRSGVHPEEIAVLYRANFQSRAIEEQFLKQGVPYQVLGVRFFERREVKDVIAYLRASLNQDSLADVKRVINTPTRGIGKSTIALVFSNKRNELSGAAQQKVNNFYKILDNIKKYVDGHKLSEIITFIINESGFAEAYKDGNDEELERLENMAELVSVATEYDDMETEEALDAFLTNTALASDQDELKETSTGVRLMTVHAAKGLEFEHVFITGLEEDLFPHSKGEGGSKGKNIEALEEERRLFYVALTRAKHKLYLSHAAVRTIFGRKQMNLPSHFLEDIDEELIETNEEGRGPRGRVIYLD